MNKEYLKGAYNSFGGEEALKADFDTWVGKIEGNENYKQGMYNHFGGQDVLKADYAEWNDKVFGVKKKDDSDSTVPVQGVASDLESGSSGSQKHKEGSLSWNQSKLKEYNPEITELYDQFTSAKQVSDEAKQEIEQRVDDEINQSGFWNNAVTFGKKGYNTLVDTALKFSGMPSSKQSEIATKLKVETNPIAAELKEVEEQIKQEQNLAKQDNKPIPTYSEEDKLERARSLKISKEIESQSNTQTRTFLKDLQSDHKDNLTLFQTGALASFSEDQKVNLEKQNLLRLEVENLQARAKELVSESKNTPPTEERIQEFEEIQDKYKTVLQEAVLTNEEFLNTSDEIGNAKDNLDVFKRNYGWMRNFSDNAGATALDLTAGLVDSANWFASATGTGTKEGERQLRGISKLLTDTSSEVREGIAKPIQVEDINSMGDLGQWFMNTAIASQVPIYAAIATGTGGIAALGLSATGTQYEEMRQEELNDDANYSWSQKALVPLGYGASETVSAMVDRMIMLNAGKVIKAATEPERKLISQGMWRGVMQGGKEIAKGGIYEGVDESATEIMQNVLDKFVLGKNEVGIFDNVKDAAAAGIAMGLLLPAGARVVSTAIKPFSLDNNIHKANQEILKLENALESLELSPANRAVIESQLDKAKIRNNSLLEQKVKDIEELSNEEFEALKGIERTQADLKNQARGIEGDASLSQELKEQITASLRNEFNEVEQRRKGILEGDANAKLSVLPQDEIVRLKDQAGRELMEELNPDGTKTVTIEDAQISERALENYQKENKQEVQNTQITETEEIVEGKQEVEENKQETQDSKIIEYQGKEFLEEGGVMTDSDGNLVNLEKANEIKRDGVVKEVPADEKTETVREPKVTTLKTSEKGAEYAVSYENGALTFKDKNGNTPSRPTVRALQKEYAKHLDFTEGTEADLTTADEGVTANAHIAEHSQNASQIAEAIALTSREEYQSELDYKQRMIAENLGGVSRESFIEHGDANYITQSIAMQYFGKKGEGMPLDVIAQEISEIAGVEVTEQDIIDFIVDNPRGKKDFLERDMKADLNALKTAFTDVTGLPATNEFLNQAVEQKAYLNNDASSLDFMDDEYFVNLENEINESYGQERTTQTNDISREIGSQVENTSRNGEKSRVQETSTERHSGSETQSRSEGGRVNLSKDLKLDDFIKGLDRAIDNLDQFGKENLGMNLPLVVARQALMAMKLATQGAKSVADIVSAGLNAVQQTDWYKNLSQNEKTDLDSNFIDYLNKPFETNKNTKGRDRIEKEIKEDLQNGKTEREILDSYTDRMEKMMATDYFERSKPVDKAEAKKKVDKTFEESDRKMEELTKPKFDINKLFRTFVTKFFDRQFLPKFMLNKAGGRLVRDYIITAKGASGYAKFMYEQAYDQIYKGLSSEQIKVLDKVIQLRRFIAIDENRRANDLPAVVHPDHINENIAKSYLDSLKEELGDQAFDDLIKRADSYFDTFKGLLDEMHKSGIISKESRDRFFDIDYQPREFLEFLENAETETAHLDNGTTGGLGKDQIQRLEKGLDTALVTDSQYLLSRALNVRAKTIAMNNTNRKLAEFMKKQAEVVEQLKNKQNPTKKEKEIIKYFGELQKRVKENPLIGFTETGNPVYKSKKTPNGYANAYYWVDGMKHNLFMEQEFHDQYFDALKRIFSNPDVKEKVAMASGTGLVKSIATGNNPTFFLTNTPRDFFFISTFSDEYGKNVLLNMAKLTKDAVLGIRDIRKENDSFKNFVKYGGMTDFLMDQGKFKGTGLTKDLLSKVDNKTRERFSTFFNAVTLQKMQMYSEVGFRMGVFRRSIANQLKEMGLSDISQVTDERIVEDIYTTAASSARSTMDFNQGGTLTKDLDAFIPYLNAASQGTRVMFDNFRDRPIETTLRVAQSTAILAPIPIGLSLLFLGASDREEDEKELSSVELYNKALKGVSSYDRNQYFIIFNGNRNKKGEFEYYRIAKPQQLTPFFTLAEGTLQKSMRESVGDKETGTMIEDLNWIFQNNISPVEFGVTDNISRNPLLKAALSMSTGYDFFREQDISSQRGKVPVAAEGFESASVEEFYKKIGETSGWSPARMKAAVESIITTPSTSPYVGMIYGGMDAMFSDKDTGQVMQKFAKDMGRSTVNRVVKETSDFNRRIGNKKKIKEAVEKIDIERLKTKFEFNSLVSDLKEGKITTKEINAEIKKIAEKEPFEARRISKKVTDQLQNKNTPSFVFEIKYANSAKEKAVLLADKFGDALKDVSKMEDKDRKLFGMLRKNRAINNEAMAEYMKLVE